MRIIFWNLQCFIIDDGDWFLEHEEISAFLQNLRIWVVRHFLLMDDIWWTTSASGRLLLLDNFFCSTTWSMWVRRMTKDNAFFCDIKNAVMLISVMQILSQICKTQVVAIIFLFKFDPKIPPKKSPKLPCLRELSPLSEIPILFPRLSPMFFIEMEKKKRTKIQISITLSFFFFHFSLSKKLTQHLIFWISIQFNVMPSLNYDILKEICIQASINKEEIPWNFVLASSRNLEIFHNLLKNVRKIEFKLYGIKAIFVSL